MKVKLDWVVRSLVMVVRLSGPVVPLLATGGSLPRSALAPIRPFRC